jgi:hypothetical protein
LLRTARAPHPVRRILSRSLALLALLLVPARASAQNDPKVIARAHFDSGVAAFKDRRFGEAAEEFQAAYEISPAFVVLYNIGQVNVALGRSVEAVDAFRKYLDQGAREVAPQRRREVESELRKQEARIAVLMIRTEPQGAELRLDGTLLGKTPLGRGVRVTAGKHTLEALLRGHATAIRELTVAGHTQLDVAVELQRLNESPMAPPPPLATVEAHAPPVTEADTGDARRTTGYALGGVGLAAAASGIVLAVVSLNRAGDARQRAEGATSAGAWDAARGDFDAARGRNRLGWIIGGAGGALAAAGLVLAATAGERRSPHALQLSPSLTAGGGGLTLAGGW